MTTCIDCILMAWLVCTLPADIPPGVIGSGGTGTMEPTKPAARPKPHKTKPKRHDRPQPFVVSPLGPGFTDPRTPWEVYSHAQAAPHGRYVPPLCAPSRGFVPFR